MREIKLRAWVENKYMVEVTEISWDNGYITHENIYGGLPVEPVHLSRLEDVVLMQSTGLKDKNGKGKEVYHNDIAKDEHGQVFVIEWDYPLLARLSEIWFEVIGNIHKEKPGPFCKEKKQVF